MRLSTTLEIYGDYNVDTNTYDVKYFTVPTLWLIEQMKRMSGITQDVCVDEEDVFDRFISKRVWMPTLYIFSRAREELIEIVEPCPHCDCENSSNVFWDVEKYGYEIECTGCGERIMLCDSCLHADDNKAGRCDWCEEGCWRRNKNEYFKDEE